MKKLIPLFLLAGLIISFSACKYEEGPAISLLSKKARLDGDWNLVLAETNNVDVTDLYASDDYSWKIDKNGSWTLFTNGLSTSGTWKFNDDKTEIILSFDLAPTDVKWQILKLKNSHLWLYREVSAGGTPDRHEQHFEAQ